MSGDHVIRRRGPLKVPRPSLLNEVKLADGRLAWPVARARGISEATFRARLRLQRLSPDEATFRPVMGRRRKGRPG